MKPLYFVGLWIAEALLYIAVLIVLFITFPEGDVYKFIRNFTGVVQGDIWDKYYFLTLCIVSLFIVSIIIYCIAMLKKR